MLSDDVEDGNRFWYEGVEHGEKRSSEGDHRLVVIRLARQSPTGQSQYVHVVRKHSSDLRLKSMWYTCQQGLPLYAVLSIPKNARDDSNTVDTHEIQR